MGKAGLYFGTGPRQSLPHLAYKTCSKANKMSCLAAEMTMYGKIYRVSHSLITLVIFPVYAKIESGDSFLMAREVISGA